MNNVLIIGGTSSLAPFICKDLKENEYQINLMTYRNYNKINNLYKWEYLNLENIDSINVFINNLKGKYKKIIILPGNAYNESVDQIDFNKLKMYYEHYIFNYIYLSYNLLKFLENDGQMISISSIAANMPVKDANYSAVKGAIQSFFRSLSIDAKPEQAIFSIAPPTINDDIRKEISNIILNADRSYNGALIQLYF